MFDTFLRLAVFCISPYAPWCDFALPRVLLVLLLVLLFCYVLFCYVARYENFVWDVLPNLRGCYCYSWGNNVRSELL